MTEELTDIRNMLNKVAAQCEENTHRIETNEINSRALNVVFKHFPKFDAEKNFIKPKKHLEDLLEHAYKMDKPTRDPILKDVSKIHYLFAKDPNDCSFIARFLRQEMKDAVTDNTKLLSGYKPYGKNVSVEHDVTAKQRREKGKLLRAMGILKSQRKEAKVVYGGNAGYMLMLNGVKYAHDSEVVQEVLKQK